MLTANGDVAVPAPLSLKKIATLKAEELPTVKDLKDAIPKHCFEYSTVKSLGLVVRDGKSIIEVCWYLTVFLLTTHLNSIFETVRHRHLELVVRRVELPSVRVPWRGRPRRVERLLVPLGHGADRVVGPRPRVWPPRVQ